jgi:glucokinase
MTAESCVIALDVGGTSVKSGVVYAHQQHIITVTRTIIDSSADADAILASLTRIVVGHLVELQGKEIRGLALAFPGPFDYEAGICQIQGLEKFGTIYGVNIRHALQERLDALLPILFRNDAESAIVGECLYGAGQGYRRIIGVTLGTGLGSAFIVDGVRQASGKGVPEGGWLYEMPFKAKRADDCFSIRGITARLEVVEERSGDLLATANRARQGNDRIRQVFAKFGADLADFLQPFVHEFAADAVLVLGGIAGAFDLFEAPLRDRLTVPAITGSRGADAPLLGVAELFFNRQE